MRSNINKHHLNWERRQWEREPFARRIREHPGMIIPMNIHHHNELHREIQPIAPMYKTLAIIALNHLNGMGVAPPELVIPRQADFLWYLAEDDAQLGHEAFKYADHLEQQIAFLGLRPEAA